MADQNPERGSTPPEQPDPPQGEIPPMSTDEIDRALGEATSAVRELGREAAQAGATRGAGAGPNARPDGAVVPDMPDFDPADIGVSKKDIDLLSDVNLNVTIELGRTRMLIEDVLRLAAGAVIELDKLAGDPVDVYVNERLVAKGEVLVLNDNFCVRINEIVDAAAADRA